MPKTRAERFELYMYAGAEGTEQYNPSIVLDPATQIEISPEGEYFSSRISYVWVDVKSGPHSGEAGYLPKTAILDCDLVSARVGLTEVGLTGTCYGASGNIPKSRGKTNRHEQGSADFIANGTGFSLKLPFDGKGACQYCLGTADQHKIYESEKAKELALSVHEYLRNPASRPGGAPAAVVGGEFMIGVLESPKSDRTSRYLAVSNGFKPGNLNVQDNILSAAADRYGLRLITREEVKAWDYLRDFRGKTITEVGEEKINVKNMFREFLNCAGPKLLQQVVQSYQSDTIEFKGTLFLSEVWYSGGNAHDSYADRESAESCDRCAVMVPRMLCGYKNRIKG